MCFTHLLELTLCIYRDGREVRKDWNFEVFQYPSGSHERERFVDRCSLNPLMCVQGNGSILYIFYVFLCIYTL